MKHLMISIVLVLAGGSAAEAEATLPDSPAGRLAAEYIEAFNSGEQAMRAFHEKWTSPTDLERMPMARRLRMYEQLRSEVGQMRLLDVLRESERGIALLIESSTKHVTIWSRRLSVSLFSESIENAQTPPHVTAAWGFSFNSPSANTGKIGV